MKNNELTLVAKATIFATLTELERTIDANMSYAEQEMGRYKEDLETFDKESQKYEISWRIEKIKRIEEELQAYEYIKNNVLNISL